MAEAALFHEVEYVTCTCGHVALDHAGEDRSPRNGGCFATGSGFSWSRVPKCRCTRTAGDVLAATPGENREEQDRG